MLEPKLEAAFQDIFGGQPDNSERLSTWLKKKELEDHKVLREMGPWVLEYEARGDTFFSSGATPQEAYARTEDKEPGGWIFNNIETQREWFKGVRK